ncbi:hypothetical protein BH10PSE12_BH10PSE12_29490 [soil metagenome]
MEHFEARMCDSSFPLLCGASGLTALFAALVYFLLV